MRKIYIQIACLICILQTVQSKVWLPSYFGDHMVLQQQTENIIHGKSESNKQITLVTSWNRKKYITRSDSQGLFSFTVVTPVAGGPYSMTFSDGEPYVINDILIGELWFCSGQSNMEMPVKGYKGQPVFGSHPYIVKAKESRQIRLFSVKNEWSKELKDDVGGEWMLHSSQNVGNFSAAAYFLEIK